MIVSININIILILISITIYIVVGVMLVHHVANGRVVYPLDRGVSWRSKGVDYHHSTGGGV